MQPRSKSYRRIIKTAAVVTFLIVSLMIGILVFNSKSMVLSQQDRLYLRKFLNDWHINKTAQDVHKNFESELSFISLIQDSTLWNITGEQIPHAYFGNVSYYYKKRQGICYDRAALIEKILLMYHFPFRHVYIYFGEKERPGVTAFFKKDTRSHAALEVKTQKGWMAVGTDANWLGINKDGRLMRYYEVRQVLEATAGKAQWQKPITMGTQVWRLRGYRFQFIYGVYSRHGDFFSDAAGTDSISLFTGKRHFLPDYNLRMLLYNF